MGSKSSKEEKNPEPLSKQPQTPPQKMQNPPSSKPPAIKKQPQQHEDVKINIYFRFIFKQWIYEYIL